MQFTKTIIIFLFIGFALAACKKKDSTSPANPNPPKDQFFAKGADISWLTQMEAEGQKFYNAGGTEMDCMELLKNFGVNAIRLRAWVDP